MITYYSNGFIDKAPSDPKKNHIAQHAAEPVHFFSFFFIIQKIKIRALPQRFMKEITWINFRIILSQLQMERSLNKIDIENNETKITQIIRYIKLTQI